MKKESDKRNSTETVVNIFRKTTDISKKVVVGVQSSAKDFAEKTKNETYLRKLKKYNPLFPEKYFSENFNLPNMIVIVDDAVRRGIDVCEGAIGWTKQENGMEILCLYDEAIEMSGITFVPDAQCDAIYYVDRFDRSRFIKIECLFSKAQEEKVAELEYIAYCLGAKSCSVEISESSKASAENKIKIDSEEGAEIKETSIKSKERIEKTSVNRSSDKNISKGKILFEGSAEPQLPELKWFRNDENINKLIQMRCNGQNTVKSMVLKLEGASTAVMSTKTACAIDHTVSKIAKNKKNVAMESQASKENYSTFIFNIEF